MIEHLPASAKFVLFMFLFCAICRFSGISWALGRHSQAEEMPQCYPSKTWRQTACKPGSVHTPKDVVWPFLWDVRYRTPRATHPKDDAETHPRPEAAGPSYSVLLPVGFTLPPPSPGARCALTAPFHPCLPTRRRTGGLLSVALSLGSPPPGVTRHRVSVEPGLSSPCGFPRCKERPSSRLAPPSLYSEAASRRKQPYPVRPMRSARPATRRAVSESA